jgi:predicted esterase
MLSSEFSISRLITVVILGCLAWRLAPARAAGLFDGVDNAGRPVAGKEVKVHDPDVGGAGYYTVYLPSDYSARRPFPIIFSYHGQFEEPQGTTFRQITGGKGFIIIGMEYQAGSVPQTKLPANVVDPMTHEVDAMRRIAAALRADLKVDPKQMFIGGFSQGGLQAQAVATRTQDLWAGVVVLGAGRVNDVVAPKTLSGVPYLIAIGDGDADYAAAKLAADYYKKLGADVTLETFAGKAHVVDTTDPVLRQWLLKYGPHRQITIAMTAADTAIKARKLGEALNQYSAVASMDPPADEGRIAIEGAKSLSDKASTSMASAEQSIAGHDFAGAAKELVAVSAEYAGNDFGRRAAERLKAIQSDPAVARVIAQAKLDADSDVLEAQGATAETTGDYPRAIASYQLYLSRFATAHRVEQVRAKLLALQSNKDIQSKQAETDCRSWLSLADNFLRSGLPEKARPYLQRILDTYGSTPWADEARARLKQLDGGSN